jgi:hypothetical protein
MNEYYSGNYHNFSHELGIDASHLHKYLAKGIGGGRILIGSVMKFCKGKGLDYRDYLDLK